jgi:hypothetical protein
MSTSRRGLLSRAAVATVLGILVLAAGAVTLASPGGGPRASAAAAPLDYYFHGKADDQAYKANIRVTRRRTGT